MKTCIAYTNTYNFLAVLAQRIVPDDEVHIVAFNYGQSQFSLFLEICNKYVKPKSKQLIGASTHQPGVQPRMALIQFPIAAVSYADSINCGRVISDVISREPQAAKQMGDKIAQFANYLLNAEGGQSIEILSPLTFTPRAEARQAGRAYLTAMVAEEISDPTEVEAEVARLLGEESDVDTDAL